MDVPCPECGSGSRNVAVTSTLSVSTATHVESFSIEKIPESHRPWHEKWLDMLIDYRTIKKAYEPKTQVDNLVLDKSIRGFFISCGHVTDWLVGDLVNLPMLTDAIIHDHYRAHKELLITNAVCNTAKHHTRVGKNSTEARIGVSRLEEDGQRNALISYGAVTQPPQHEDALDLATRCLTIWRSFFMLHGIDEPTWISDVSA